MNRMLMKFRNSGRLILTLLSFMIYFSCSSPDVVHSLNGGKLILSVSDAGRLLSLSYSDQESKNLLDQSRESYLLSLMLNDSLIHSDKAEIFQAEQRIQLHYSGLGEVSVHYFENKEYLTFEIQKATLSEPVDAAVWGPYYSKLDSVIGECIGVVQGDGLALGLQSLNAKTIGGFPWKDNDCMPEIDIFDQEDLNDLEYREGKRYVLYRLEAAMPTESGSRLQAYCRDRSTSRTISNMQHDFYIASPFEDGGIIGSKIGVFVSRIDSILPTIANIEVNENLPHPLINGEWAKTIKAASDAYLIMDFSESNIDSALSLTQKAGLKYLYHSSPFKSWGHYELNPLYFPNGNTGLKKCVDQASELGIAIGVHTLSNFIQPNDDYVSPIPDERLAKIGGSKLAENLSVTQTEIFVESPQFFRQYKNNNLHTVQIGKELIRYDKVSDQEPWTLLHCQRGSFGTEAGIHQKGDPIALLADGGYKIFYGDADLNREIAQNIARLFNETGIRQLSFDGIEGCQSACLGNYGEALFAYSWYHSLEPELRNNFICDASRTSHFFWHIFTRMNWGEPWYAGFRESQADSRFHNQLFFKRNLIPGMLGWFQLKPETTPEDIEWMLAKAAGYDAGFALCVYDGASENGNFYDLLAMVSIWEKARQQSWFTMEQKAELQSPENEFHLVQDEAGNFRMQTIKPFYFEHVKKVRQPGEPLYSTFDFENSYQDQEINISIRCVEGEAKNIRIDWDHARKLLIPWLLKKGESIRNEKDELVHLNFNQQVIERMPLNHLYFHADTGMHSMDFDTEFESHEGKLKIEIRVLNGEERIG